MTLGDGITKALQILNTYSIGGVPNPDTYNNQADMKIRLCAFANDAQQEIARTNGRIKRETTFVTRKNDFAFQTTLEEVESVHGGETEFTASGGHSYSLNVCGDCTVSVYVSDVLQDTKTVYPPDGQFVCVKGIINNPDNGRVKITINGDYDYLYKNVGIYMNKYASSDNVPEYSYTKKATVPSDYIEAVHNRVLFNNERSSAYRSQGRDLYLEGEESGEWRVTYYAKPQEITSSTPLTYEFEVPAQTHDAIPYKMAYLIALDIGGVYASVLTAIKNEYAQLISSVIEEPQYRTVGINNVYGV